MRHIIDYISNVVRIRNRQSIISSASFISAISLCIFLLNSGYVSYPDEFVNLLGGKYILAGKLPYRDFFDHHLPFAWYFSSFLLLFSFNSFPVFRALWALSAFAGLFLVWRYMNTHHKNTASLFLIFLLIYPVFSLYYWLHLFLADSLAALFFSIAFWLLIAHEVTPEPKRRTLVYASLALFAGVFSSMSYIYLAGIMYLWIGISLLRRYPLRSSIATIAFCSLPYGLYAILLLITGSFHDFWIANVVYNTELYISIPNYTRGAHFNPIKFALTLLFNFHQHYIKQIVAVKDLDIYFPVATTVALGSFILILAAISRSKVLAGILFLVVSFSAPRSAISSIPETDYQAGVYLALGFSASLLALNWLRQLRFDNEFVEISRKVGGFLLLIYLSSSIAFLGKNVYDKAFQRYTQVLPSITNIIDARRFVDDVLPASGEPHTYWAGPYEPTELFYFRVNELPGKYISLLPQFAESTYFSDSFLAQFEASRPAIIIYRHEASIFSTPADIFGRFFLDWLAHSYTTVDAEGIYQVLRTPSNFEVGGDVYIRNDLKDMYIQSLLSKGYITPRN